jgi:hypothetical protein
MNLFPFEKITFETSCTKTEIKEILQCYDKTLKKQKLQLFLGLSFTNLHTSIIEDDYFYFAPTAFYRWLIVRKEYEYSDTLVISGKVMTIKDKTQIRMICRLPITSYIFIFLMSFVLGTSVIYNQLIMSEPIDLTSLAFSVVILLGLYFAMLKIFKQKSRKNVTKILELLIK